MTNLKKTIYYLIGLSIIFLLLSYVVSVNKELAFLTTNSPWISNDYLFTCFSGAFASIIVLIATEVYKYIQVKKGIEQFLFTQLAFLYGQLQIADRNINKLLSKDEEVACNLFNYLTFYLQQILPQLRTIDYNPIIKTTQTSVIEQVVVRLFSEQITNLDTLGRECIYLPIAINTDKIEYLQEGINNPIVRTSSPKTNKVLIALQKIIRENMSQLQMDISEINAVCNNRFHWAETERNMSNVSVTDISIESFLERNK